ncbi:MAG: hypothetical protein U9P12_01130 [Verrucomicrobiota bacterium]|nr:hypothetical protein [Verrucomicrobiota bacterium]
MKDVTKLADNIAMGIEGTADYFKKNWKTILVVLWMLLATITLIQLKQSATDFSTYHQVANMKLSVDDVRYSFKEMEADMDKVQGSVAKMERSVTEMQSTVNRIHTQVRNAN